MKSQSQTGWLSKQRQRRIFSLPRRVRKAKAQKLVHKKYKESKLTGSHVAPADFYMNVTRKINNGLHYTINLYALRWPHDRAVYFGKNILLQINMSTVLSKNKYSTISLDKTCTLHEKQPSPLLHTCTVLISPTETTNSPIVLNIYALTKSHAAPV